jgi:tetratricopeptide (TPR) repeat protein
MNASAAGARRLPSKALAFVGALALLLLGWYALGDRWRAGSLRRQAEAAAAKRDFATAYRLLSESLKLQPDRADLHFQAARVARRGEGFSEARFHLERSAELAHDPDPLILEHELTLAQRGQVEGVEGTLQDHVDRGHADAVLILEALVQGYLGTYRFGSALSALKRLLEREPANIQAWLWQACVHEHVQNLDAARQSYEKALELDPEHAPTRLQLADLLRGVGRGQDAVEHYQRLWSQGSRDADVCLGLAHCRRTLGQADQARELLQSLPESLDLRQQGAALLLQGRLAVEADQTEQAEKLLRRAHALLPHDKETIFALAECLERRGQTEAARPLRQRWRQLDEDWKQLIEVTRAVSQAPHDPDLRCQAGALCLRLGRADDGLRWLATALRIDANHAAARRALAEYQQQGVQQPRP